MRHLTRRSFITTTSSAVALAALSGNVTALAQDDKPTLGIGSKVFTESHIVAEALGLMLEDAGYSKDMSLNLGGTAIVHEALVSGDIHTYVEYTGTGLIAILGQELPETSENADQATPANATPDASLEADPAYQAVAKGYAEQFNIKWLKPWGFNNTYALAIRSEMAEEHGLRTMSDLEAMAGDLDLGSDQEFPVREDGLPAFEETYGYSFNDVVVGDIGLMYQALANGDVDVITAYATDGRIPALDLVLLEDDKHFFPPYHAAPIVRQDVLDENPEIEDILNQPAGLINNEMMASYNAMVDEEGVEVLDAARSMLQELGILGQE